jgi:hypothetical protein
MGWVRGEALPFEPVGAGPGFPAAAVAPDCEVAPAAPTAPDRGARVLQAGLALVLADADVDAGGAGTEGEAASAVSGV